MFYFTNKLLDIAWQNVIEEYSLQVHFLLFTTSNYTQWRAFAANSFFCHLYRAAEICRILLWIFV